MRANDVGRPHISICIHPQIVLSVSLNHVKGWRMHMSDPKVAVSQAYNNRPPMHRGGHRAVPRRGFQCVPFVNGTCPYIVADGFLLAARFLIHIVPNQYVPSLIGLSVLTSSLLSCLYVYLFLFRAASSCCCIHRSAEVALLKFSSHAKVRNP